jgi:hypothetical protein
MEEKRPAKTAPAPLSFSYCPPAFLSVSGYQFIDLDQFPCRMTRTFPLRKGCHVSFLCFNRLLAVLLSLTVLIFPCRSFADENFGSKPAPSVKNNAAVLTCFSVEPPKPDATRKREDYPTCDDLCAKQDAVCTGMQNSSLTPPVTCADHTSSNWSICRCCKVQQ